MLREKPARVDRSCRHNLTEELPGRICDRDFECGACSMHETLRKLNPISTDTIDHYPFGLFYPLTRLYHRGHTWVEEGAGNTATIGLDALGERLVGNAASVEMPAVGDVVKANQPAWNIFRTRTPISITSPVDGVVTEVGGPDKGFYLKVSPVSGWIDTAHLLREYEVQPWLSHEMDRLLHGIGAEEVTARLPDGGVLMADLPRAFPSADWPRIWPTMFSLR